MGVFPNGNSNEKCRPIPSDHSEERNPQMHALYKNLGPYVFENIVDGVVLLTGDGTVAYSNKCAQSMLDLQPEHVETSFLGQWLQQNDARNDGFCQAVLDVLFDKKKPIDKKVNFFNKEGQKLILHIKSSYWNDPEREDRNGVLLIMQDITKEKQLQKEKEDSVFLLSGFLVCIGVWTLFYAAFEWLHIDIPGNYMTYILLLFGLGMTSILFRKTDFKFTEMGISFKDIKMPLIFNGVISFVMCLMLIAIKAIMVSAGSSYFPENEPFFDFTFTLGMQLYPMCVVMQEFLAQGIVHECLIRILKIKNAHLLSILVSAILFTVLHIHRGFMFMIGSMFLVCIVGFIYRKQRTIWGICITHYTVSMMAFFLNLV